MFGPIAVYKNKGLQAYEVVQESRQRTVRLGAGTYPAGTVLGEVTALAAADDVQTLTFTGSPAGNFVLGMGGQTFGPTAYSAAAAALQANLQATFDAALGAGVVAVAAASGTSATVTFQGPAAAHDPGPVNVIGQPPGGTLAVARTTPGRAAGGMFKAYSAANADGTQLAKGLLAYDTVVDALGRHQWYSDRPASGVQGCPMFFEGQFLTSELVGLDAAAVGQLGRMVKGSTAALTAPGALLRMG